MRRFFLFILLLLAFLGSYSSYSQDVPKVKNIPGKIVIKLKPQFKTGNGKDISKLEKLTEALASLQATGISQKYPNSTNIEGLAESVDLSLVYEIKLPVTTNLLKACQTLHKTGLIEYAETMRSYEPLYQPNDPLADSTIANGQYYLKNIKAYKGWDLEKGDTSIVIGISDSGIRYTHKDLAKNIKFNYADKIDGIDNDNDGFVDNFRGWDFADNDNDATFVISHGVGVSAVASALTNNGKGMSGVGFNCKFLPLKIYATNATGSFGGYESVVYAANHGCSIINLSWGGPSAPSLYEQDVINYAVINKNAVVVAAAGNTDGKLDFFPASYNNVISVALLDKANKKHAFTTYSTFVDLSAPGALILTATATNDSSYNVGNGSSYASPMVAGAAGLVKKKFPQFNAQQIGEQLRVTADASIYSIAGNGTYTDMLGKGLLDIAKALSTTNAKSVRYTRIQSNKPQFAGSGDTLSLTVDFKNFLQPVSNLGVTLTTTSPHVTITQSTFNAGAMATLATTTNTLPFKVYIKPGIPVNQKVALKFNFTDGTYTDYQYYELVLNQDFVTIDINKLQTTITSKGNIGYQEYNPELGNGVRYQQQNLLSEGGLLVGTAPTEVSDNVRNAMNEPDQDFFSQARVHFINSVRADMEAEGMMQDSFPASGMAGVNVKYNAYAWQNAPKDKFVIVEYHIKNQKSTTLTNLYAGMFADWDIFDSMKNSAGWENNTRTGYTFNVKYDTLYTGIKLLTPGAPSFYALENVNPTPGTINITNGFTDAEKYQALSGGLARLTAGSLTLGNDVSYVIGSKLPDLPPTQSVTIAFALMAGKNLTELTTTAQAAQTAFNQVLLGRSEETIAGNNLKVYPNPASAILKVVLPATLAGTIRLELTDALGRTLMSEQGKKGETVSFNTENLAAGLYFVKAENNLGTSVQKVQLIK